MNIKFNVKTRIRFNGQEYASVEAMPPDVRQAFEKAMSRARETQGQAGVHTSTKVVFNGREFASVLEMPPDVRSQYEQAMNMVDKDHDGIPDMLETSQSAPGASAWEDSTLTGAAPLTGQPLASPKNKSRAAALVLISVLVLVVLVVLFILVKAGMH